MPDIPDDPELAGSVVALEILDRLRGAERTVLDMIFTIADDCAVDPRWLAIGRADIQKGFMSIRRAVAFPNGD